MKRIIVLLVTFMCLFLVGCQMIVEEEEIEVAAVVAEMEYEKSYIQPMLTYDSISKTAKTIPQYHAARYLVTVTYEDISETFNNQSLYENVKEGEIVEVILVNGYDKEGNLIRQMLKLHE